MTTNAAKITAWREDNPNTRITERTLLDILSRANLYGANLRGADLCEADLRGADLYGANLRGANLYGANLYGADLRWADLRGANLRGADLYGADLYGAYLPKADLRGAYLRGADLYGADLYGADLYGARWHGLTLNAGPSGRGDFRPTPDGWRVSIGCWQHKTLADLDDLIHDRVTWPEAEGAECDRRRPYLQAVLDLCRAHEAYHFRVVPNLAKRWGGQR